MDKDAINNCEQNQTRADIPVSPAQPDLPIPTPRDTSASADDDTADMVKSPQELSSATAVHSAIDGIKRCIFLVIGLFVLATGVSCSIKATLGTSPISSIPNVLSIVSGVSVGTTTMIFNTLIVLVQIPILNKDFKWPMLLQIPVSIIFGLSIDVTLLLLDGIIATAYPAQWLLCMTGIVLVGLGVSFEIVAGTVTLASEGFIRAICTVGKIKFATMKIIYDCTCVLIALIISLAFLRDIEGVREGTVAAAVLVGLCSKVFMKPVSAFARAVFKLDA